MWRKCWCGCVGVKECLIVWPFQRCKAQRGAPPQASSCVDVVVGVAATAGDTAASYEPVRRRGELRRGQLSGGARRAAKRPQRRLRRQRQRGCVGAARSCIVCVAWVLRRCGGGGSSHGFASAVLHAAASGQKVQTLAGACSRTSRSWWVGGYLCVVIGVAWLLQ